MILNRIQRKDEKCARSWKCKRGRRSACTKTYVLATSCNLAWLEMGCGGEWPEIRICGKARRGLRSTHNHYHTLQCLIPIFPGCIYSKCLLLMKVNLNFQLCSTDPFIFPTGCAESQKNFLDYWYMGPLWNIYFFLNA